MVKNSVIKLNIFFNILCSEDFAFKVGLAIQLLLLIDILSRFSNCNAGEKLSWLSPSNIIIKAGLHSENNR